MAAKRITKSSINWIAFAESVPSEQKMMFNMFKAKSDKYLNKALSLPENPPKIDWAAYRKKIIAPGIVDNFEKEYSALKVPYPKENVTPQVDEQEKQQKIELEEFLKRSQDNIAGYKVDLERWMNMIPIEHMTLDDFKDAFPETAFDPLNRPTFWPHDDIEDEEEANNIKPSH